ncbi:sulfatase-like hydrolase/transferase [Sphingobium sp. DEHP117]|uniref:sulfatase-like hydrolase/transferase n=1 Tax=Sphingobium sp. DEHP117 TaxID=2993436 RepID=UPI0027D59F38|nr:sulfatase-like hydrolase/transferase [Sphingobium sp. DEHP117]MDQ4421541.1 sulfatase-like hydrolase/transferase [Sphingobium sp. DEHP117]
MKRQPNFIVIYCDDLGYGDIGPMGGRDIATPHLDRLAREGVTLTDYYAPANVCTPSRAGLLTGRYPIRTGLSKVLLAGDKANMPRSEVTIAQALKPAYTSALIGKWHLGHSGPAWAPTFYGFDLFYGIPYSHDIAPLKVFEFDRAGQTGEWDPDYPRLQQHFCSRAEKFIEEQRDRPFFLELALSSPHLPNFSAPGFEGKSRVAGAYGDTVMEIDAIVGRLLDKLKALGIDRDTLLVFTSDNGPWFEGSTGGMRQRKGGGGYDGGYRVPFIARWPGRIPVNRRSGAIAMGIDLLPTFCGLAGIPLPSGVEIDGKDITSVLTRGGASPHADLLLFQGEEIVGVRTQAWKYVSADFYMERLMLLEGRGYPQLYDMARRDEQYSVASLHPKIVEAMQHRLRAAQALFAPLKTGPSPLDSQRALPPRRNVPKQWQLD